MDVHCQAMLGCWSEEATVHHVPRCNHWTRLTNGLRSSWKQKQDPRKEAQSAALFLWRFLLAPSFPMSGTKESVCPKKIWTNWFRSTVLLISTPPFTDDLHVGRRFFRITFSTEAWHKTEISNLNWFWRVWLFNRWRWALIPPFESSLQLDFL